MERKHPLLYRRVIYWCTLCGNMFVRDIQVTQTKRVLRKTKGMIFFDHAVTKKGEEIEAETGESPGSKRT